jgi:hypothetical protein
MPQLEREVLLLSLVIWKEFRNGIAIFLEGEHVYVSYRNFGTVYFIYYSLCWHTY